ncbi:MAG: hypothetical protein ACRDOF_02575 [Gaiellaceae bacterium]
MRRVPLLAGSRVVIVPMGDDDVVIRPPAPPAQVVDTGAAVRDALRFPLSGPSLDSIAPRGGSATILVEPWALPLPGANPDPRQEALAAIMRALELSHVRNERQTILIAGGLGRRFGRRELERLLPPPEARAFRGNVLVHDAAGEELVPIAGGSRIHPALLETELVVVLSAAETIHRGGPRTLVAACDATMSRGGDAADSLLEAGGAPEWDRALEIEDAVGRAVPLLGVSLVLDLPRLTGALSGYPDDDDAVARIGRSWTRAVFSRLPAPLRRDILETIGRRVAATAAFAGPPSVAHAEALLRGVELRGTQLDDPLDTLVIGAPWIGPHVPREPVNAVTAATVALGLALRLYRNEFPLRPDGTLVLCHPLTRSFAPGIQAPYARMFEALQEARTPGDLVAAEAAAAADERALAAYRAGKACHPLLPYADWAECAPALARLGRVVVAGSRDAIAARTLGFVPSHSIATALEMAHGVAGEGARSGILLAPPYAPLLVGRPG